MDYKTGLAQARKRRAAMKKLREDRWTFREIGEKYGISWQRVQQILKVNP